MERSLVSVVMSTYNEKAGELSLAIESILQQSYTNFEFVIVNDNPGNKEISRVLDKYEQKDNRIRIIRNSKNIGLARSLNEGISEARGEYIARMDADDIALPHRLEHQMLYLKRTGLDLVSGYVIRMDEDGQNLEEFVRTREIGAEETSRILPFTNIIFHSAVFSKKSAFTDVGGYRPFPSAQDYDLWLRMQEQGKKLGMMDEVVLRYRVRRSGISVKKTYEQYININYISKLHRERQKNNGKDEFTEENLQKFLEINGAYDPIAIERYKKSKMYFSNMVDAMRNKRYVKVGKYFCMVLTIHPAGRKRIIDVLRYKIFCKNTALK